MYQIFNDLKKIADESMDVIECHFSSYGIDILGEREGRIVRLRFIVEGGDGT